MHKFLVHHKGDHVGVATSDISAGETVIGVFMEDDSTIEVKASADIPLGHKIAIRDAAPQEKILKYGLPIGFTPEGFRTGDYVHTHNIKTLRW